MWSRFKQAGKILTSGVLFLGLGIGGVLFTFLAIPAIALLPGGPIRRKQRARKLIHISFRFFVFGLEASGILKVAPKNIPPPGSLKGTLIVANHPSYLDIVVILALLPDAVCVVKNDVWRNPFFGPLVRAAGFIPILDAERTLEKAEAALKNGLALVIFPEGTRSRIDRPLKFQRGVAYLALRTGAPVLLLLINVTPSLLAKGHKWYNIPASTCRFMVRAVVPADPGYSTPQAAPGHLRARQWTESLETFFQGKLHELQRLHD